MPLLAEEQAIITTKSAETIIRFNGHYYKKNIKLQARSNLPIGKKLGTEAKGNIYIAIPRRI